MYDPKEKNLAEEKKRALQGAEIGQEVVYDGKIHRVEITECGQRYPALVN